MYFVFTVSSRAHVFTETDWWSAVWPGRDNSEHYHNGYCFFVASVPATLKVHLGDWSAQMIIWPAATLRLQIQITLLPHSDKEHWHRDNLCYLRPCHARHLVEQWVAHHFLSHWYEQGRDSGEQSPISHTCSGRHTSRPPRPPSTTALHSPILCSSLLLSIFPTLNLPTSTWWGGGGGGDSHTVQLQGRVILTVWHHTIVNITVSPAVFPSHNSSSLFPTWMKHSVIFINK